MARQHTLAAPAEPLHGVGLHTGQAVTVRLLPADENAGLVFARTDLPGAPQIKIEPRAVNAAALARRTEISNGNGASVATIEHLVAALFALGIDNARIELDGPEVPILDGSAQPFAAALARAGRAKQSAKRKLWKLKNPVALLRDEAEIMAIPAEQMHLAFFADLRRAGCENQSAAFTVGEDDFAAQIAPARTFVFYEDLEKLRAAGLIKGGSLECAIVMRDGAPWETEYRLPNELAAHKLLDLIGDLALLGRPLGALVTARATGHALHHEFVMKLLEELEADE